MGNKNEFMSRNIIVSDFEVAPYDPDEYEYNGDQKCHGQIIVNRLDKTITFRHISGTKPIFYVVLVAMSINKNWCRIFKPWECEDKYKDHMLLIRDWPAAYYVAHKLVQRINAQSPIFITLLGIVILERVSQSQNVNSSILVIVSGIIILDNSWHL